MSALSKTSEDLLLLCKGHYGYFNEHNIRNALARAIEFRYWLGLQPCQETEFQVHCLVTALLESAPNYFNKDSRRLKSLLKQAMVSADQGILELISILRLLPVQGEQAEIQIDLPDVDSDLCLYLTVSDDQIQDYSHGFMRQLQDWYATGVLRGTTVRPG